MHFHTRPTHMNASSDPSEDLSIQNDLLPNAPPTPLSEKSEEKQTWSSSFTAFVDKLNALPTPEEKIAFGLEFMKGTISQEGSPRFREFWEARRLVLPFFRENVNSVIRPKLWGDYVELTVEARKLKEILEEQSSFAMEQIDLAIQALESDLAKFAELLEQGRAIPFPQASSLTSDREQVYYPIQRELNLLNTLASRLNGLRKE